MLHGFKYVNLADLYDEMTFSCPPSPFSYFIVKFSSSKFSKDIYKAVFEMFQILGYS